MTKDRTFTTAIHLLSALAKNSPRVTNSDRLANSLKTNPGLVRRVLSKLSKTGWIETVKGKGGGSKLAVSAESINLRMIYESVVAGPLFRSFEKEPYAQCAVSCQIGGILDDVYGDLENELLVKMESRKLSEIVKKNT
ncbi:MAG: Rrf2 family transcriptional regulator [Candidatus Marinimicrobia bacterium]|nr:Rrf2 family transcriptional regulator [Candidatus Neomarinimicrobiota bacterium]